MNTTIQVASRKLKFVSMVARGLLWLVAMVWLLFLLGFLALHVVVVPGVERFRPHLEKLASQSLGIPVQIGAITADGSSLIPSFSLTNVVLLDAQQREALRLRRVVIAVSPWSLWHMGFEQLYVDQPELDIRRSADGKIWIAGLNFSQSTTADGRAGDWIFRQPELVIQQGTVRWTDEMRNAPMLELKQVDLMLRTKGRRHELRLDATPPSDWGDRFTLMAEFREPLTALRRSYWESWRGQFYANFSRVDVSQLRNHINFGVDVAKGRGALRFWSTINQGEIENAVADVWLSQVEMTLGAELPTLILPAVKGRLEAQQEAHGFTLSGQNLMLTTRDGLPWNIGNATFSYQAAQADSPERGELSVDQLDLAVLTQIGRRLPFIPAVHTALTNYRPEGVAEQVKMRWDGAWRSPEHYQLEGRLNQFGMMARAEKLVAANTLSGSPVGIKGATIEFKVNEQGGQALLEIKQGALTFPDIFAEPVVPIDFLKGGVAWQVQDEKITLEVTDVEFANADARCKAQAKWQTGDPAKGQTRFPGVLNLTGQLQNANGARVYRYLPLVIAKDVRTYVHDAIAQGHASRVDFRVNGDLQHMPFPRSEQGLFYIAAQLQDVNFAFVPPQLQPRGELPWPVLKQLKGELIFEGVSMEVKAASGALVGKNSSVAAPAVSAKIADFGKSVVRVEADVKDALAQMLGLVAQSPIAAMLDNALTPITATGAAELRLNLELPIAALPRSKVKGTLQLQRNELQLLPEVPKLSQVRGKITFTETGFGLEQVQAQALGGAVEANGHLQIVESSVAKQPESLIKVQGDLTVQALQKEKLPAWSAPLVAKISGSTSYIAQIGVRDGVTEFQLDTDLKGLAIALPAPINKVAEQSWPLRFKKSLVLAEESALKQASKRVFQDKLELNLAQRIVAEYRRDLSGEKPLVLRGRIGVGLSEDDAIFLPKEQTVNAKIQLDYLDVDAWKAIFNSPSVPPVPTENQAVESVAQAYQPKTVALRANKMKLQGRLLHNLVMGVSQHGAILKTNIVADEVDGYLEYRPPQMGRNEGGLYVRMLRLNIPKNEVEKDEDLLGTSSVRTLPALDLVVDNFELSGKKLGRFELIAVNSQDAKESAWQLKKFNIYSPEAEFYATGTWKLPPVKKMVNSSSSSATLRHTAIDFRLILRDAGGLLGRLGMPGVIRAGQGSMEGQVRWIGSPLGFDYPSMQGKIQMNIEKGQFLKADPGLAKLLGVLSLQSLPRRFNLDFRDVFSQGFPFDFVRGDVWVDAGIAKTNNLQMKGVSAAVLMDGEADIAKETQNLRVIVVPEIDAGTASLVATVINPAVGIGTFLAQLFLRGPLIEAATQEFQIKGTWVAPEVTRVKGSEKTGRSSSPSSLSDAIAP